MRPDFYTLWDGGSIVLLAPCTRAGEGWIQDNLPEDRQTLGNYTAIEHRYFGDIAEGIANDGLTIGSTQ